MKTELETEAALMDLSTPTFTTKEEKRGTNEVISNSSLNHFLSVECTEKALMRWATNGKKADFGNNEYMYFTCGTEIF